VDVRDFSRCPPAQSRKGIRAFCFIVVAEHQIERHIAMQARDLAHLIVKANAAIMKVHFRRKTTSEESKFPTANYRTYANA
jgi:hypothetical protein